jgi:tetratricopeptide (TPR) repeat protein
MDLEELGRLLLRYADMYLKAGRTEDVRIMANTAVEVLNNTGSGQGITAAYRFLYLADEIEKKEKRKAGRADSLGPSPATPELQESESNLLSAVDHITLARAFLELYGYFRSGPNDLEFLPDTLMSRAEEHLKAADKTGANHEDILSCQAELWRLKGNLREAKKHWLEIIRRFKDKAQAALLTHAPLSGKDRNGLRSFCTAALSLGQSCFSFETGEILDDVLFADRGYFDDAAVALRLAEKYPEIVPDTRSRVILHGIMGRLFAFQSKWPKAFFAFLKITGDIPVPGTSCIMLSE